MFGVYKKADDEFFDESRGIWNAHLKNLKHIQSFSCGISSSEFKKVLSPWQHLSVFNAPQPSLDIGVQRDLGPQVRHL